MAGGTVFVFARLRTTLMFERGITEICLFRVFAWRVQTKFLFETCMSTLFQTNLKPNGS